MAGDDPGDLQGAGRVRVGGVQDARSRPGRGQLDERGDVGGGRGVVHAGAAVGEEQHRAAVEHALDEHPLAGLPRSRAVDLGRAQHGDRDPAVQQHLLGGDLAGRIAFRAAVVPISGGHGGLVFPDRAAEVGVDRGVGVAAGPVHVDGLAGDQHGRRRVTGQGQQPRPRPPR